MRLFRATADGIEVRLTPEVRTFLGDVLPLLAEIGDASDDRAAQRLRVPVYLDDPGSNEEWWRLMGPDLDAARQADRLVFRKTIESDDPVRLGEDDAGALLRVLNETRLALGARMGVEVEDDWDDLPEHSRMVLAYLGSILEELTEELSHRL